MCWHLTLQKVCILMQNVASEYMYFFSFKIFLFSNDCNWHIWIAQSSGFIWKHLNSFAGLSVMNIVPFIFRIVEEDWMWIAYYEEQIGGTFH